MGLRIGFGVFLLLLPVCVTRVLAENVSETPFRVGAVLPLTGEIASWGQHIRQGLDIALEDVRHKMQIDYQDEGNCDAKRALGAVTKLLDIDHTKILFMGCLAGTKASGSTVRRARGLMLSTGLLDEDVYKWNYPVINLATQLSTESRFLARHLSQRGFRRIAVIRWPDAFGEEFARTLKEELRAKKAEVLYDEYSGTMNADFRSVLPRFRKLEIDAIVTTLGDSQISSLRKQLHENQLPIPIISNYIVETTSLPSNLLEGIEYTYPVNSAEGSSTKDQFDKRFAKKYEGQSPTINTYFAYDGLLAIDRALDSCKPSEVLCIRTHILRDKTPGLSGEVTFNPNGSSIRPYGIKRIEDGKFVWLTRDLKL